MATTETDIEAMTEAELLVLPESVIPSGSLTKFWALHAAATEKENADELARELSGASRSRRMTGAGETREDAEIREQKQREAWARDMRLREDRLVERIEAQEREIEKQRREIDDRAIRLADGRHIYVDGDGYRDTEGRRLEGRDCAEAAGKRQSNSATWAEREENERQLREAERLRKEIEENRKQKPDDRKRSLTVYEHQFNEDFGKDKAKIEAGQADYGTDFPDLSGPSDQGANLIGSCTIPQTQQASPNNRGTAPKV